MIYVDTFTTFKHVTVHRSYLQVAALQTTEQEMFLSVMQHL
jgi:hypothetical protein